jgi:hypothetical protein
LADVVSKRESEVMTLDIKIDNNALRISRLISEKVRFVHTQETTTMPSKKRIPNVSQEKPTDNARERLSDQRREAIKENSSARPAFLRSCKLGMAPAPARERRPPAAGRDL